LAQAADILDMPLLDHLIVGDAGRYFSFREAGTFTTRLADGAHA
jgi:DNA repair protein RadC